MKKKLLIVIIIILFLSIIFFLIDKRLIINNNKPFFMISIRNNNKKKEIALGLFYVLERNINNNFNEDLVESKNVKFGYLFFIKDIKYKFSKYYNNLNVRWEKGKCDKNLIYSNNSININSTCINDFVIYYNHLNKSLTKDNISLLLKYNLSHKYYPQYAYHIYMYHDIKILKCNRDSNFVDNYYLYPKKVKVDKNRCDKICLYTKTVKVINKNIFNDKYIVNLQNLTDDNLYTSEISKNTYDLLKENDKYYLTLKSPSTYEIPSTLADNITDYLLKIEPFKEKNIESNTCL